MVVRQNKQNTIKQGGPKYLYFFRRCANTFDAPSDQMTGDILHLSRFRVFPKVTGGSLLVSWIEKGL
jgi:hypothetical protein